MRRYCSKCGNSLTQKKIEDKPRDYCSECDRIFWKNPKPFAWVLVQKGEEFLLVKRAHRPDKGKWDIPGGFLELEESFRKAAIRELKEETGLEIEQDEIDLLDTISFQREDEVVGTVFRTEVNNMPELEAGDDADGAKLWDMEELQDSKEEKIREACKNILLSSAP